MSGGPTHIGSDVKKVKLDDCRDDQDSTKKETQSGRQPLPNMPPRDRRFPKRKIAMLVGFDGCNYSGLQRYAVDCDGRCAMMVGRMVGDSAYYKLGVGALKHVCVTPSESTFKYFVVLMLVSRSTSHSTGTQV